MKRRVSFVAATLAASAAWAQTAVQDDFEAGAFHADWALVAHTTIRTNGGAAGSINCAALALTNGQLGARFDSVAPAGANGFTIDGHLRITNTAQRQFNLMVSDSVGATGSGAPSVNLRYQGGWAAFSTAWQPIAGPGSLTTGAWHRFRLTGRNWGRTNAVYDLEVSDAGGSTFTSGATNLAWYQGGNPSNNPARYFTFTTIFGGNPGFDVDEVTATVTETPIAESNLVIEISGTYPHLAVFNGDGEAGMGAVVPWANRLWFLTYPPHQFSGSPDKLWTVDSNLTLVARAESVGGTHANRMIHSESQQLVIGPYFITTAGSVRVVSPATMPGRLTANARHLTDPTNRILFATMEEGFYEVDVNTLAVTTLKADAQTQTSGAGLLLPGNHGKGCYTAQGRVLYANNGESTWNVASDPKFNGPAGLLAENTGGNWSNGWTTVERKNFTEITGPGGIRGATNDNDVVWSLGWDKRSVLLKVLDGGVWSDFRLPKGSYTHDALLGWYTEWPRIREIVDGRYLMHMHGLFYDFPRTFSAANAAGLRPLCTYLKMPVDYCWWNGRLVMARDDASTTGGNIWAGQSHSAPWFGQIEDLGRWGAPAGFGGPWREDGVTSGVPSPPFLMAGFAQRALHLKQSGGSPISVTVEIDATGQGAWIAHTNVAIATNGYAWHVFPAGLDATWVRLVPNASVSNLTAYFHLANTHTLAQPALFAGLADVTAEVARCDGILRPKSGDARTLEFAASYLDSTGAVTGTGYYEIGGPMQLRVTNNATSEATLRSTYSLSNANFTVDAASVIYVEGTNRFRLPKSRTKYDTPFGSGWPRGLREVVTERRLLNAHGTIYEVPYANSGGFRRIRPVATHNKHISDFASWRGLFAIAGVAASASSNGHVFRSDDGQAALWFGNVDDLWRMGPPTGSGGPWSGSVVTNGAASDPYLMFGFERKLLLLSHAASTTVIFTVEVDFAADGTWSEYARFSVPAGQTITHVFPHGYSAHWVRLRSDTTTTATARFVYGPAAPVLAAIGAGVQLRFSGLEGDAYTVRASDSLFQPFANWVALTSGVFGVGAVQFDDATATNVGRFYGISLP